MWSVYLGSGYMGLRMIYGNKDLGLCLIPLLQDSGTIWHVLRYPISFQVPDPEGCGRPTDFVSLSSVPLDVKMGPMGDQKPSSPGVECQARYLRAHQITMVIYMWTFIASIVLLSVRGF